MTESGARAATESPLGPVPPAHTVRKRPGWAVRLLVPSFSDCLFMVLMAVLFMGGTAWSILLVDGDTGLHIRTGDFILATHTVPARDLFSFTAPQSAWYAWEWLADTLFAGALQLAGLKGVVLLSATVICLALTILFRYMVSRGVGLHIALVLTIVAAEACRFHYLARPHIFTMLLAVISFCILDRDWPQPSPLVWWLVPVAILWTNLHGGFLVLIVALTLFAAAAVIARDRVRLQRYSLLAAACSAATFLNPYGWRLHQHIWSYLQADWLPRIDEFQSPVFHTEPMLKFEILLFFGLISIAALVRARRYHNVLLILFWAYAALSAVRHVTIYVMAAVPPIADWLGGLWKEWTSSKTPASFAGALRDILNGADSGARRSSVWIPVFLGMMLIGSLGNPWPADFPKEMFPADMISRNRAVFAGNDRILNPDQWGGYIAYHFYPARREFIDGRSDYFGPAVLRDYASLRSATAGWQEIVDRYQFQFALIPPAWPLAGVLRQSPNWVLRDSDSVALLFERRGGTP